MIPTSSPPSHFCSAVRLKSMHGIMHANVTALLKRRSCSLETRDWEAHGGMNDSSFPSFPFVACSSFLWAKSKRSHVRRPIPTITRGLPFLRRDSRQTTELRAEEGRDKGSPWSFLLQGEAGRKAVYPQSTQEAQKKFDAKFPRCALAASFFLSFAFNGSRG